MFKRLAEIFSSFFSSLFGGNKNKKPVSNNRPTSKPDKDPNLIEDSSDVPVDTVMVIDVMDVDIPISDNDPGPFADKDKEGAIDDTPTSGPTTDPNASGDGGSSTSDPQPDSGDSGSSTSDDSSVPSTPPQPEHKQRYLWCLDNGHGKLQAGKRSPIWEEEDSKMQFFEYEFNRDIVERIIKVLDKKGVAYFDVVPDYKKVGSFLEERVARVNKEKSELPKLFVSVHSNAGPAPVGKWVSSSIKGVETWFAHNSTKGKKMAAIFQKHILAKTGFKNRKLKSTKIKNLYVLIKTVMPAILTENGFYNNKEEVKELMKDSVRQKVADAHIAAIMEIEKHGL